MCYYHLHMSDRALSNTRGGSVFFLCGISDGFIMRAPPSNFRPRDKSLGNPAAKSFLPGTGRKDFEMRVQRGSASLAGAWGQRPHYRSAGGTI